MPWCEIFGLDSADSVREEELAVYRACRGGPARRDRVHGHRELPRPRDRCVELPEGCAHASACGDQLVDPGSDARGPGSGSPSAAPGGIIPKTEVPAECLRMRMRKPAAWNFRFRDHPAPSPSSLPTPSRGASRDACTLRVSPCFEVQAVVRGLEVTASVMPYRHAWQLAKAAVGNSPT